MKKILFLFASVLMAGSLLAETKTIYLKPTGDWLSYPARYTVFAMEKTDNPSVQDWVNMTEIEDGVFEAELDDSKHKFVVFCRMDPNNPTNAFSGGGMWNQTKDLGLEGYYGKLFTVKNKIEGGENNGKYDGEWSDFTPSGSGAPQGFYITGDEALVGKKKEWHSDAIKSDKDTFLLNLTDGDYKMKVVTLSGVWKGYSNLTEKAKGLYAGSDDNICFTLAEPQSVVKVIYNNKMFKLEGTFVAGQQFEIEDGYYLIGLSGWEISNINKTNKFELTSIEGSNEYQLETTLAQGQSVKVVEVKGNEIVGWYPDGMGTEYTVDKAHAGTVTIYFKTTYQDKDDWKAFGGYMYVGTPGEPTPDPDFTGTYYITGNAALVGEEKAWNEKAIESKKDTLELNLKAGDYQMKLTFGTWETAKGFYDLTEKGKGITPSSEGNICFSLAAEGVVKVVYNGIDFKLLGDFDETKVPVLADGYYLIGQFGWEVSNVNATLKFEKNGSETEEYQLEVTLVSGQSIKVVEVKDNEIVKWFPDGMGTDYSIDAFHAGKVTIYFKPAYQDIDDWKSFGGFMYIAVPESPEPGPEPVPVYTGVFYLTGDSALVVDAGADASKEWDLQAVKSEKDTLVLNLKAGNEYKLKVVLGEGTEAVKRGFSALTEKAKGLYADVEDNICFSLAESGEVKVIYTGKVFKLEGKFNENTNMLADGFYLIGQKGMTVEDLDASLKFSPKEGAEGEYVLKVKLEAGQKIKVAKVQTSFITKWYPEGADNQYVVSSEHAGDATVYFSETAKEEWKAFGGYIFVEVEKQGIDNTAVENKAVKVIRNGQLIILKNGVEYNVLGLTL